VCHLCFLKIRHDSCCNLSIRTYFYIVLLLFSLSVFEFFDPCIYYTRQRKKMRSSTSSILPKQRMKICRSVTVQDALPDGEKTKYENDRAYSTSNMYTIGW